MNKMPERIWAGYYTAIEGLPSPIWFDEKPENNGDLEGITEMITSTPLLEHAEEMRNSLKYCVKALYDAVHRANVMNMPLYAGEAIQDAQYWLETIEKAEREVTNAKT